MHIYKVRACLHVQVFLLYLYFGSLATLLYFQFCILRGRQVNIFTSCHPRLTSILQYLINQYLSVVVVVDNRVQVNKQTNKCKPFLKLTLLCYVIICSVCLYASPCMSGTNK